MHTCSALKLKIDEAYEEIKSLRDALASSPNFKTKKELLAYFNDFKTENLRKISEKFEYIKLLRVNFKEYFDEHFSKKATLKSTLVYGDYDTNGIRKSIKVVNILEEPLDLSILFDLSSIEISDLSLIPKIIFPENLETIILYIDSPIKPEYKKFDFKGINAPLEFIIIESSEWYPNQQFTDFQNLPIHSKICTKLTLHDFEFEDDTYDFSNFPNIIEMELRRGNLNFHKLKKLILSDNTKKLTLHQCLTEKELDLRESKIYELILFGQRCERVLLPETLEILTIDESNSLVFKNLKLNTQKNIKKLEIMIPETPLDLRPFENLEEIILNNTDEENLEILLNENQKASVNQGTLKIIFVEAEELPKEDFDIK